MLQLYYKGGLVMKQKKLVAKMYQACLDNDVKKVQELKKKQFEKIIKRKAQGKEFDSKWHVVTV